MQHQHYEAANTSFPVMLHHLSAAAAAAAYSLHPKYKHPSYRSLLSGKSLFQEHNIFHGDAMRTQ